MLFNIGNVFMNARLVVFCERFHLSLACTTTERWPEGDVTEKEKYGGEQQQPSSCAMMRNGGGVHNSNITYDIPSHNALYRAVERRPLMPPWPMMKTRHLRPPHSPGA